MAMPARSALRLWLLLALLYPALGVAQSTPAPRNTELVDPRTAGFFYRPERVETEKPDQLLDLLGIAEGEVVADIGAGPGFFSLRAADRVGATGRVLAVDVQPELLDGLRMMMRKTGRTNIEPILGSVGDPKLPPDSVDHVLLVLTYHEFLHPAEMMRHIHAGMKRDATMLLVEYKREDPASSVKPLHKMSEAEIMTEIPRFGFVRDRVIDLVPGQHIFVFKKIPRP